jgi:hypothetical protein
MLDVHVMVLPGRDPDKVRQCMESVGAAIARAPFPIEMHILEGTEGHIGVGRYDGYTRGHQPYMTYVDDDDYVLPHAFLQMADALDNSIYLAVSTPELIERNGYTLEGKQRHHLVAYRRDMLIDHRQWACCGDVAQLISIPEYGWHDLANPGYVHRVYESPARLMRRANQDELMRALTHDQSSLQS